jgi:hypothetical protein
MARRGTLRRLPAWVARGVYCYSTFALCANASEPHKLISKGNYRFARRRYFDGV